MRIVVYGVPAARESARKLGAALGVRIFIDHFPLLSPATKIINYGNSVMYDYWDQVLINRPGAVRNCIDKVETFKILKKAGVKIPQFATNKKDIGKDWDTVVVRSDIYAAKNQGLDYWYRWRKKRIPDAPLYTKFFEHKKEFRVCVLRHEDKNYVEAYQKVSNGNGEWELIHVNHKTHDYMKDQCILAAEALKIDYVGFDVLYNSYADFVILEANSAPILTEEMVLHFKQLLGK